MNETGNKYLAILLFILIPLMNVFEANRKRMDEIFENINFRHEKMDFLQNSKKSIENFHDHDKLRIPVEKPDFPTNDQGRKR